MLDTLDDKHLLRWFVWCDKWVIRFTSNDHSRDSDPEGDSLYFCYHGRHSDRHFGPRNRICFKSNAISPNQMALVKDLTLRRPLCKKLRKRWFFDVFKVKESSFSKSDLTDPPQIFDAHLLENTNLSPSRFHFSGGFISRSCFESDGLNFIRTNWIE